MGARHSSENSTTHGRALDCAPMSLLLRAAGLAVVFFATACSSSSSTDSPTDGATDGTSSDAASETAADTHVPSDATSADTTVTPDAPSDGGCNGIANIALEVVDQYVASPYPGATGGPIADGVYVVTAVTHYTGAGGRTGAGTKKLVETLKVAGNSVLGVRQADAAAGYAFNATIVTSLATLKWKQTCPDGAVGITYGYAVGDSSLDVYEDTTKTVTTYTKKFITPGG